MLTFNELIWEPGKKSLYFCCNFPIGIVFKMKRSLNLFFENFMCDYSLPESLWHSPPCQQSHLSIPSSTAAVELYQPVGSESPDMFSDPATGEWGHHKGCRLCSPETQPVTGLWWPSPGISVMTTHPSWDACISQVVYLCLSIWYALRGQRTTRRTQLSPPTMWIPGRVGTETVRLGGRHLYLQGHLTSCHTGYFISSSVLYQDTLYHAVS